MSRTLLWVQAGLLALGTALSWAVLFFDYRRFFASGGHVLQFSGCAVTNPLATPCFYGALAFLAALLWALAILRSPARTIGAREQGLQLLIAAGTLFAWGNFAYLAYRFLRPAPTAAAFSCPPAEVPVNPLTAPCFYGALIFLAALVVSVLIRRAWRWSFYRW